MEKQNRQVKKILKILNTFSDDQQEIFIWHIVFKDKPSKIAEDLTYDEDYVKSQLKLMKRALRWTWRTKWYAATHEMFANKLVIKTKPHLIFEKIEEQLTYNDQNMLRESLLFQPQELSPAQKRIRKLRRLRRYVARYSKVAMFMLLFMILCTGTAFAMIHLGLIQIENDNNTELYISSSADKKEVIEKSFLPAYLPKGYEFSTQIGQPNDFFIETTYLHNNNLILFRQTTYDILTDLDNEDINSNQKIQIQGNEAILQEKQDVKILVWMDNNYFYYIFCNDLDVNKDELIKIAESTIEYKGEI